jgi:hypothetical protein
MGWKSEVTKFRAMDSSHRGVRAVGFRAASETPPEGVPPDAVAIVGRIDSGWVRLMVKFDVLILD